MWWRGVVGMEVEAEVNVEQEAAETAEEEAADRSRGSQALCKSRLCCTI